MRLAPVRLLAEGGEQPVPGELADDAQARPRHLTKARFVAQFRDQIRIGDEQADAAAEFQLEDTGGKIAADAQQIPDQSGTRDLVEMPDDRKTGRRWEARPFRVVAKVRS